MGSSAAYCGAELSVPAKCKTAQLHGINGGTIGAAAAASPLSCSILEPHQPVFRTQALEGFAASLPALLPILHGLWTSRKQGDCMNTALMQDFNRWCFIPLLPKNVEGFTSCVSLPDCML